MKLEVINEKHDLEDFFCGTEMLDRFLKTRALIECNQLLSKTFVITNENKVIAFCTLVLHSLKNDEKELFIDKDKIDQQRVPALLIGQLAVDQRYKGHKIGASLIQRMIQYAFYISKYANFPAIIVDAHTTDLVSYYEDKGFKKFKDKGLRLFMTMAEIIKTFNATDWQK